MVAVGDSAEVELIYTSSGGHGGQISKSATVSCNDNERANFPLTLKVRPYEKPDSLKPLALSVASVNYDEKTRSQEVEIAVRNVSKQKLTMKLVSYSYGYLKVDVPDSEIKPGKEKEIKVKIDRTLKDQEFKKSFTFEVNDSVGSRYTIPVVLTKPFVMPQIQQGPVKKASLPLPDTVRKTDKIPTGTAIDTTKKSGK